MDEDEAAAYDTPCVTASSVEAIRCASVMAAKALVEEYRPQAVFVDSSVRGARDFVKWIKRSKGSSVVVMGTDPVLKDAKSWGADGHIEKPLTTDSIALAMSRLFKTSDEIQPESNIVPINPSDHSDVHVITQEVIAVWGAKGGAGRTTVAAHLAAHLSGLKVLLIDMNFAQGPSDLSALLRLPAVPHMGRMLDNLADRRQGFIDALIEPPTESFTVVQPPPTLELAEQIGVDDIVDLIDQARRQFNIVILDLPPNQTSVTMEAVDMATTVLFVTLAHNGSIARIEAIKDQLKSDVTKMLVLNRFNDGAQRAREISYFLDMPVAATIREDVQIAENMKSENVFMNSNAIFSEGIVELGKSLLGFENKGVKSKWSLFGLLKAIY